jgi:hypothetical protein
MGVGTEQPYLDSGRGKCGIFRSDGQVAGGDQLAAGGRGDTLHLCDHWLRNRLQFRHQLRADVEQAPVFVDIATHHLRKVVSGGKDFALRRQNHYAQISPAPDLAQAINQLVHESEGKGVTSIRPIQGDQCNVAFGGEADVFVTHPMILMLCIYQGTTLAGPLSNQDLGFWPLLFRFSRLESVGA